MPLKAMKLQEMNCHIYKSFQMKVALATTNLSFPAVASDCRVV